MAKGGFEYLDEVARSGKPEGGRTAPGRETPSVDKSSPQESGGEGFSYLDAVSKDEGGNKKKLSNLQVDQEGMEESPAEGGEGYVGGNSNASSMGFDYVTGKKGSVEDRPIWSSGETSFQYNDKDNSGTGDEQIKPAAQDSTDENASYKHVQTDEGLPQTYRSSWGAGDAGPSGSDEPDQPGGVFEGMGGEGASSYDTDINQQTVTSDSSGDHEMSEMPQTVFTESEGGGAPKFKHAG